MEKEKVRTFGVERDAKETKKKVRTFGVERDAKESQNI